MRLVYIVAAIALLGGCDRAERSQAPEPAPSAPTSAESAQASIIRPEIAAPATTPPPLEPLELTITFSDGGTELGPEQLARLTEFVASPQIGQGGPVTLGGHSDSSGTDAANLAASRKRGEAVRDWLVEHGIAEQRISLIAFGEQNPVRPNALPDGTPNERGRAANRRVEIHVPVADPIADPREPTLAEEIVDSREVSDAATPGSKNSD
jgi:OOP family OmpA-OmpF porin